MQRLCRILWIQSFVPNPQVYLWWRVCTDKQIFCVSGNEKECCVLKVHLGLLSNLNWQLLYAVSSSNKSSSSCIIFLTLARRYATLPVRPCAIDSCIKVSSARVLRKEKCNKSKEWGMDGVLSKTETTRLTKFCKLQSKTDETIIAV